MKFILYPILFVLLSLPLSGWAVRLSDEAEISVMTCGPNEQIYAIYGHSAIRVNDPRINFDVVFNYGVFSFNAPNFVYRFAKGQTDYMLAAERFTDFLTDYQRSGRSIREQVLNLTAEEKQRLFDFLINNARPENREYRYNFFFDNCASRVRDVVEQQTGAHVVFLSNPGDHKSFREHVSYYQRVLPWTNFGIQLVLGSPADEVASAYQEMFLPDYLGKHLAAAVIQEGGQTRQLVKQTNLIYEAPEKDVAGFYLFGPQVLLSLVLLIVVLVSVRQFRTGKVVYWPDYVLLFLTGLIGWVLLWFVQYSEHPAMRPNYNLLWALPTNFVFLFLWLVKKWRPWLKWYWLALFVWLVGFLLSTLVLPQSFIPAFYLIVLMLLVRAAWHSYRIFFQKG